MTYGIFQQPLLTSEKLKFKKKEANIAGLQLADLLAFSVKKDIISENLLNHLEFSFFEKDWLQAFRQKYNRQLYSGEVSGYGKILIPK